MGCDIHMVVEVKRNGKWTWLPGAVSCQNCYGTLAWGDDGKPCFCVGSKYRHPEPGRSHGYDHRAYDTFGVLANVRNGTWGNPTPFISEPRDLPDDMDERLDQRKRKEDDEEGGPPWLGDHSFTHLTLAELLAFDWSQPLAREATISWDQFKAWDRKSPINEYCAWASGETLDQEEAEVFLRVTATISKSGRMPNVRAKWTEPLSYSCEGFRKFMHELEDIALRERVETSDVRIVFGFDS